MYLLTILQAAALLLFNNSDRLSYSEIMTQLNLTHDDVVRLLHSLSCAKYKILTKEPNTRTVSTTDNFEFNSKFTDRMRRIKVFSNLSFSHLIYSLIFPTAFLVPPSPQLGNYFLFYLFIYCFLCIRNDKLLKIFQL